MNSLSELFVALFLCLLSVHLGLSTEFPVVTWLGCGLAILGYFNLVTVERPTWGLLFVLLATGALGGNQLLEDWALEGSWPQNNGLGAGLAISFLLYLTWVFAARTESRIEQVLDRDTQTILVFGLLMLLLIAPPENSVAIMFDQPVALLTVAGLLLACLSLFAGRCSGVLLSRLLLLLPLLLLTPLMVVILQLGQGPVIAGIANLFPASSSYTPTGFSPYQQLRASLFLRPSNRAVMRIEADGLPSPYLAGNRLVTLNSELAWEASEQAQESLNLLDATSLPNGEFVYPVVNHHAPEAGETDQPLKILNLGSDNFIFMNPGTTHVTGRFTAMTKSPADVWTIAYDRGADRRWLLDSEGSPVPDIYNDENLQLPEFWDNILQSRSEQFRDSDRNLTVSNVLQHFQGRGYSLQTDFDPEQPFHDFFLNDKSAYCFWFATATTLALRANNIPSRLVGGYVVHEQLTSNLWLVRERDAHSWVEWQDEAGYWHTIDPTPASIFGFFEGYQFSAMSVWYHSLAGQWQILDRQVSGK